MNRMVFATLALLALFASAGCKPKEPPAFRVGQIVESVTSGIRGQVIDVHEAAALGDNEWVYGVRFPIITQHTQTHLIGRDGPIATRAFCVEWLRGYELQPTTESG